MLLPTYLLILFLTHFVLGYDANAGPEYPMFIHVVGALWATLWLSFWTVVLYLLAGFVQSKPTTSFLKIFASVYAVAMIWIAVLYTVPQFSRGGYLYLFVGLFQPLFAPVGLVVSIIIFALVVRFFPDD